MTAAGPTAAAALSVHQVAKSFGPIEVLLDINLEVSPGERRALIGPNGAGKSTLFNLISGRFPPTSGKIMLGDRRIDGKAPHLLNRSGVSRSFQITQVFGGLDVFDNVQLAVMSRYRKRWSLLRIGPSWKAIREETHHILRTAQLDGMARRLAGTLAYSDQRALEICMTVATGPDLILLDEPTSGMSRAETATMVSFIARMTEGRTLLMVEHDMDVVFGLADSISVLANGRVLTTGKPADVRDDPRVQEAYLGGAGHH